MKRTKSLTRIRTFAEFEICTAVLVMIWIGLHELPSVRNIWLFIAVCACLWLWIKVYDACDELLTEST